MKARLPGILARKPHQDVNHVPGLVCKRCYRFVPSYFLSLWERKEVRALTLALSQRERELRTGFLALENSESFVFCVVKNIHGIILAGLFLLAPTPAFAHAYLVKSVPASRATLFNSPGKIQLWFNERLEPKYSFASVLDPDGKRVDSDDAHVLAEDPKRLAIGVKKLPAGKYIVKFRVLSVDGHVVEQSFPFTIREAKN